VRQYRQGDVLLVEAPVPHGTHASEQTTEGRWILAHGEATGHAHAIAETAPARVYRAGGKRYLHASDTVELVHEEHGPISIAPGTYRVRIQREYVPSDTPLSHGARTWGVGSVRPVRD
jgi:hypothetical protein